MNAATAGRGRHARPGRLAVSGVGLLVTMLLSLTARADEADRTRVGRQLAASCATCHGTEGKGQTGMPVLAGISKPYFLEQMRAFATGERKATIMHQLGKGYTKEQIEMLAEYFSSISR